MARSLRAATRTSSSPARSVIQDIHGAYFAAGADVDRDQHVRRNAAGAGRVRPRRIGAARSTSGPRELAREAADAAESADGRPRWVAGSIGPTTKAISRHRRHHLRGADRHLRGAGRGPRRGRRRLPAHRDRQDTRNIKAALLGSSAPSPGRGERVPVAVSGTIEPMGTMLAGQSVEALATSLEHVDLLYLGLNCATGPEFMTDHIRSLAQLAGFPVGCVPNAGPARRERPLPRDARDARALAAALRRGRAGSTWWAAAAARTPGTSRPSPRRCAGLAPRSGTPRVRASALSGVDYLEVTDDCARSSWASAPTSSAAGSSRS